MQSLLGRKVHETIKTKNLELIEEIADRTAFISRDAMVGVKWRNKIESEREKSFIAYHDTIVPALEEIVIKIDKLNRYNQM